ncbi:microfibril-associated glycoprotein 4-like [Branchiostoma floridae]|uniref:Microfibril-associated glycoprotein 4-like n=1 Tax=Branchiostoma floridae TaxID=7739 RepID=A0A9J7KVB2_BRAFL|nr:microfibril-associated glycoprotein 4-like [Branchiostoma floridae]
MVISNPGNCLSTGRDTSYLAAYNGWHYYKVPVTGEMTSANVKATCEAAGYVTPCSGDSACQYSSSSCFQTGLTDCDNPMIEVSQQLCGAKPRSCPQLYGVYQFMNNWINGASCGAESGGWCTNGNEQQDKYAFCAIDCAAYLAAGQNTSGVYTLNVSSTSVEASCDMDNDGNVEEYKLGFGNKSGEYWLGNDNIHLLTMRKNYKLRITLKDWSADTRFAEYSTFRVSGEADGYRLHISGYSGNAGDSMTGWHSLNGQSFSTVDRDNDDHGSYHCSQRYGQGGWWFRNCGYSFLNGRYLGNCGSSCPVVQGVVWYHWRGAGYSLKSVSMKIRP